MNNFSTPEALAAAIKSNFNLQLPIDETTPLLSSGIIDSFRFAALLQFLESRFAIRVGKREVGVDNFDTVTQIFEYIKSKQ